MIQIKSEDEILDNAFRANTIKEIISARGIERKRRAKKRYDCFRDRTREYVIEMIRQEYKKPRVVQGLINRATNVSFLKQIIEKKAQVYRDPVKRMAEINQDQVDTLAKLCEVNLSLKKLNVYTELFKNGVMQIVPVMNRGTFSLKLRVLRPFDFDVLEDYNNPEEPLAYVLSYYDKFDDYFYEASNPAYVRGRTFQNNVLSFEDGKPTMDRRYIWWSDKYHFTTNDKGAVVPDESPVDFLNPIGKLPFVSIAKNKDGTFWAEGGDDLVDGCIAINLSLTDLAYILKYQGMGIFYLFGKGIPKEEFEVGPASVLTLDMEEGDPAPNVGFANPGAPIEQHLRAMEQHLAFLLSSNGLDLSTIQGQLSANSAQSGLQEMIRRAENTDQVEDQRSVYKKAEKNLFDIMFSWHNNLIRVGKHYHPDFLEVGNVSENEKVETEFTMPAQFATEMERLEVIGKRKELGLDTQIDSIMRDNPDLSEEQAVEKLEKIKKEKQENMQTMMPGMQTENEDDENEDDENENENEEENEEDMNG